ncbi:MAG TPA: ABC transporter permease [Planctomycetota bacterium]|nr:ABC transporter permease [Planctomycetota bacterium]
MFGRLVAGSLWGSRARLAPAVAAVLVPAALVTAAANFSLEAADRVARDFRRSGPNVILEPARGAAVMAPEEVLRARALLPEVLAAVLERPDRVELAVPGTPEALEAAVARIGRECRTVRARTIPAAVAKEAAVLGKVRGILAGVALLVLTTGGAAMALSLAAAVAERRREIGLLRALGAGDGAVARLVAAQVGAVLALGVAAGAAVGFLLAAGLSRSVFGAAGGLRPEAAVAGAGACALASALAAIVPMRRALRVHPAEALRGE